MSGHLKQLTALALALALGLGATATAGAADKPAAKPTVRVLSLDADLQRCVSGELQSKLTSARIMTDPLAANEQTELVLVMFCEPQTVELRDRRGQLHTVPIQSCASVLSEYPGQSFWRQAFPKSQSQRRDAHNLNRRLMVVSSTGPMSQICRHVLNQASPVIYRWLFDRQMG